MPNWSKVLEEIEAERSTCIAQSKAWDEKSKAAPTVVRTKYLDYLHQATGRNIICYYSGWLSKPNQHPDLVSINDEDMNGFMMAVHQLDRSKGLDLFLHTPGGGIYATQAIVSYLHSMFDGNIRAIVPEIAMSAGTMIACCCNQIIMGEHSNLGPIDPQINGEPAESIREVFQQAIDEITANPNARFVWDPILRKYPMSFLSQCENAVLKSKAFVKAKLEEVMFAGKKAGKSKAAKIVNELSKSGVHSEHLMFKQCKELGLNVERLETIQGEKGDKLQDLILTVHHCYMHLLMNTGAIKIIENHKGIALIKQVHSQR